MKLLKGRIFIKFPNDNGVQDKITFENGQELEIVAGRVEEWANSIGEVVYSGVEGVNVGQKVGVSYQTVFGHSRDKGGNVIYHNRYKIDGQVVWLLEERNLLCLIDGDKYIAWGKYNLVRPKWPPKDKILSDIEMTRNQEMIIPNRGYYVSGELEKEGVKEGDEVVFQHRFRNENDFGYKNTFNVMPSHFIEAFTEEGDKLTVKTKVNATQ